MWFSARGVRRSLILGLLKSDLCRGDSIHVKIEGFTIPRCICASKQLNIITFAVLVANIETYIIPIKKFLVDLILIIVDNHGTIHHYSSPAKPMGKPKFPAKQLFISEPDGTFQYTPCNIFAGTVYLSFFPENSGNVTYPPTYYDPTLSVTLTSPSIYMIVNTITGDNSCGPLGPTYTNAIISMDLASVSTLQPYADHTVTTRMGPPQPLTLSDIMSGCPGTYATFSTDGAFVNTHPVAGTYNRCHPRFVFPIELKRLGYPYWTHCSNYDYELGIFDPPAPVPPVTGLLPQTTVAVFTTTTTTTPASTLPGTPIQPSNTSPSRFTSTPSSTMTPSSLSHPAVHQDTTSADPRSSVQSSTTTKTSSRTTHPGKVITQPPTIPSPTSTTVIAVIGSHSIGAVPGSSGVILPNGSTAHPGSVATLTDSHSQAVVISVASSGIFIGGKTGSSTFIPNPTIAPIPIATVSGQVISAVPEATSVIIGTKTAFLNGPPVTVDGSLFNLTPTGVVVVDLSGKSSTTFAVPTFGYPSPSTSTFMIDNFLVSVPAGASTIAIGDQTITYGGPLVTLSNHDVLSLGPSGLVIQMPSGRVSTVIIAASSTARNASSETTSTTKGIASIIASIGGLGNATSSAQQSQISGMTSALGPLPTGLGSRVDIKKALVWMAGCLLLGSVQWV